MRLELYKFDSCPYCVRVFEAIEKQGRTDIEMHDVMENEADFKRLMEVGGKDQVPCLFIDGSPMYESLDIIDWLEKHPQEGTAHE